MAVNGGYRGRYLEVDLSSHQVRSIPIPSEQVLRTWMGGVGLGVYLLSEEITRSLEPADPQCPVFIMTGPLTGTMAPNSTDWSIITVHGSLHYHVGISHAHGYWGARLKHAGWDGIILRGASADPVFLWIDDGHVELRDAGKYWGMNTVETVQHLRGDLGDPEKISVACIGPWGENLLPGATVRTDLAYSCSKGEPGLLWGAKKLKAIAVRGTGVVSLSDPDRFNSLCESFTQIVRSHKHPIPPASMEAHGLRGTVAAAMERGYVMGKNFSDSEMQVEWGKRLAEDLKKWVVRPIGGWQCELQCHNETEVTTGPMAGTKTIGFTAEVIEAMGTNLGIEDPGVCMAMSFFADSLGMDPSEVVRTIAALMEAYNKGDLTREQTDGLDLTWGNYEAVIELINKTLNRDGIGAILAKPLRQAARELGIEKYAIHMKGVGFADYDLRAFQMWFFSQLVASGAGPAWQTGTALEREPESDLGYDTVLDPRNPEGKGRASARTQMKRLWEDSIGICLFAQRGHKGVLDLTPQLIEAAVGWKGMDREVALLVGERIINLQRLYAIYRGYKPEYDFDVHPRMLEPIPGGPAKGRTIGPYLKDMRREYYLALNWDPETGAPTRAALEKVGLLDHRLASQLHESKAGS